MTLSGIQAIFVQNVIEVGSVDFEWLNVRQTNRHNLMFIIVIEKKNLIEFGSVVFAWLYDTQINKQIPPHVYNNRF